MPVEKALLEDRGVLRVAGEDAASFLQGLLTNDVENLGEGEARYAALLSPQGKILFDFLVLRVAGGFLLDCAAGQRAELAKRLGFYRLRAKVTISDESESWSLAAFWGEGAGEAAAQAGQGGFVFADPRDARLGLRAILPRGGALAGGGDYEAHRIGLGVPKGGVDFAYADIFPHDANLDLLHGVDFRKGCYVGQEVVSRMQHRGTARKRIIRLSFAGPAPAPGTPLMAGEAAVGTLGSAAGPAALALVRLDRIESADAAPLTAGGEEARRVIGE